MLPGTRLGPYEITAPLGEGGMGEVYRATDSNLKRQVAIKVLPASLAADVDRLARFQREAEVLAALNHPNIAAIYGLEKTPECTALVMELVEGEDLSQRTARGAIPVDEALPIATQIADALEAAHEQGIIHRDLKPANIKVRPDGTVKVLDFGLAKALEPAGASASGVSASMSPTMTSPAMTAMGMIVGTAAYMAPEQARGRPVDRRADIWAFGVVLYEMLTGSHLFKGETVSDTLVAVLTTDPDFSRVPARPRELVRRCLERDPRKRLRDIGDMALLLDDGRAPSAPPIARDRVRWFWLPAAGAIAALLTWALLSMRGATFAPAPVVFSELPPPGNRFVSAPIPSPDGSRLAFVATDGTGTPRLWIRDLGDAAAQAVVGTEGIELGMTPFWSPDGRQIAFRTQGEVRRVAPGGRPSAVVVASPISGAWLNGGDLLLAITGTGLMQVSAAGGTLRRAPGFTSDDFSTLQIEGLDVSPDGNNLLFRQFGGETGVYVARLADGTRRLLFPGEQNAAVFAGPDLIVRADGRGLVVQRFDAGTQTLVGDAFPITESSGATHFSTSASGALTFLVGADTRSLITWFTREGRSDGVVGPEGVHGEVAISRDGRLLAFSMADPSDGNVDVWVQPLSGGAPRRLTSDPDIDHRLVVSSDACCVAWESHAQGALNLMERPVDGSSPARRIRTWGRAGGAADWSADGRFVLYQSADGPSGSNLWAVPRDGKGEPTRITQPGFGAADGQFSPDGRYLALTGRETGTTEIYVQRVEGTKLVGGPTRVSESGGRSPHWGRDGSELYFVNGGTIFVVPFQATGDRPAGTPQELFTIAGFGGARPDFRNFAAMPDGRRFVALVAVQDRAPHPATVILNWRASLGETVDE